MRSVARLFIAAFIAALVPTALTHAQCADSACISAGNTLTTVSTKDSALLDGMFNNLLGTGSAVDLTVAQHQTLASSTVDLSSLLSNLNALGVGTTADTALATAAPLATQLQALANTLTAAGNAAAASAINTLRTQAASAGSTPIAIGDIVSVDPRTISLSNRKLNVLDVASAEASDFNVKHAVSGNTVSVLGSTLGLNATVSSVTLSAVVLEPGVFTCGPAGTTFHSASVRVRAHVALTGASTPLTIPPLLSASLTLTGFDIAATVARSNGTITAVNAIAQTLTVSATPGIAELFLGTISDANFFDRATPIDPTTELTPGNIGTVNLGVLGLSATAAVTAKGYASGSTATASTLNFTAAYPRTLTATTQASFAQNLVNTLLSNLQIGVATPSSGLGLSAAVLGQLLTDTLATVTSVLRSTASNGLLAAPLSSVVLGVLDPLLGALGIKLGEVSVRAEAPFAVPVGASCDDGLFCTTGDTCNASNICTGSALNCADALGCTNDVCNEALDRCDHPTAATSCLIGGACVASGVADASSNGCMVCTPSSSQSAYSPATLGTSCSDGLFCTVSDSCNALGICLGSVRSCSDNLTCTVDACNESAGQCTNIVSTGCTINGACVAAATDDPTNSCMTCNPLVSTTAYSPKTTGVSCDDGQYCTVVDTCNGSGSCTGLARNCADILTCTSDACSEATDQCVHAVSTGCSINGACIPEGTADPLNPCMACNSLVSTSSYSPRSAGTSCDDGQYCTTTDVCNGSGVCTGGAARDCADALSCTSDSCNEALDFCAHTLSAGCNIGGACVAAGATSPSNPCLSCNPATSTVAYTPKATGTSCDDGLFCTTSDACTAGGVCAGTALSCNDNLGCTADACDELADQCTHTSTAGCTVNGTCVAAGTDDPSNSCRTCNPALSTTAFSPKSAGASCDDGQFCTTTDTCSVGGACSGVARSCADSLTCTSDSCNEATDQCVNSVITGCAVGGLCIPAGTADPSNACGYCNPALSTTSYSPKASGTACDDGQFCTINDSCNGSGSCTGGSRDCSDTLSCTSDSCNETIDQCAHNVSVGCTINGACVAAGAVSPTSPCLTCNPAVSTLAYTPRATGTSCDDGLFCTTADACTAAGACAGSTLNCADNLGCTNDACDETADQCTHTPLSTGCTIGGACVASGADDPSNPCRTCNPALSLTSYSLKSAGTACDDGQYCTTGDSCSGGGTCTGSARNCADSLSCTTDSCNEASDQCVNTVSSGCSINGSCIPAGSTDPTNACAACNPNSSTTSYTPKASGSTCDDGQYCTTSDSCNGSGACTGVARDCSDGFSCTSDSCNETSDRCVNVQSGGCMIGGACVAAGANDPTNACASCNPAQSVSAYSPKASGATCDDGQYCTTADQCNGSGACSGSARSCDDGVVCTSDSCDEARDTCVSTQASGCLIGGACIAAGADDPGNPCRACDPHLSVSTYAVKAAGTSCSDGLYCTSGDACDGQGRCSGLPRSCADTLSCTSDSCDEAGDQCVNSLIGGCTIDGACVAEGAADPSNPCRACIASVSTSHYTLRPVGATCDDGQYCTEGDACAVDGTCKGSARSCSANSGGSCLEACNESVHACVAVASSCSVNGACLAAGSVDPSNPCMVCDPQRSSVGFSPVAAGTTCSDSIYCTVGDVCNTSGVCVGQARSCTDNLDCTFDDCDEDAHKCIAVVDAGTCAIDAACVAEGVHSSSNPCLVCTPSKSTTAWSLEVAGTQCDDGKFCTLGETCNSDGACVGPARDCGGGSACASSCDETQDLCRTDVSGCSINGLCMSDGSADPSNPCRVCNSAVNRFAYTARSTGSSCDDGQFCTTGDSCDSRGACVGTPRACSSGSSCALACDETQRACVNNASTCAISGACLGQGAVNPANPCQVCDPSRSATAWSPRTTGTACSDGLFCTQADACDANGQCVGTRRACDDGLACTTDSCDENGARCRNDVGGGCIINGACQSAGQADPTNPCRICQPQTSTETWTNAPATQACNDGQFCTVRDTCDGNGSCGGVLSACGVGGACNTFCDESSDSCRGDVTGCSIGSACVASGSINPGNPCQVCDAARAPNAWSARDVGSNCDDGLVCTSGDACSANGTCTGVLRSCDDGLSCTSSVCNEAAGGCTQDVNDGCAIDGTCVQAGSADPTSSCRICDPARSRSGWSFVAPDTSCNDGQFCTSGDRCDAAGSCVGGSVTCPSDGLSCTVDSCDETLDLCVYSVTTGCAADGECVAEGVSPPDDACLVCRPAKSSTGYTYEPDRENCDSDHDGLRDGSERAEDGSDLDTDGDGRPNYLDPDDDGDGIATRREHSDDDNNGLPDQTRDLDGDGIPDYLDADDDGDSRSTLRERQDALDYGDDVDSDGTPNWFDTDSDGDGASDLDENAGDGDINNDGIPDYLQAGVTPADDDHDGLSSEHECAGDLPNCPDSDGDGHPDYLDPDDDNDGVLTKFEIKNGLPQDTDGDGLDDHLDIDDDDDSLLTTEEHADPNGDGNPDDARDSDGDGIPDYLDADKIDNTRDDDGRGNGIPDDNEVDGGVDAGEDPLADVDGGDNDAATELAADAGSRRGGIAGGALCSTRGVPSAPSGLALWLVIGLAGVVIVRRSARRSVLRAAVMLLVFGVCGQSRADVTLERFTPAALTTDGLAVPHDLTFKHLRVGGLLALDFAKDPLIFEANLGDRDSIEKHIVRRQLVAHAVVSLDLFQRLAIFVQLPVNLLMSGQRSNGLRPDGGGLGNVSLGARVRVWQTRGKLFSLGAQGSLSAPTSRIGARDHTFSGEDTLTSQLDVIGAWTIKRLRVSGNVGAYLRAPQHVANLSLATLLTFGVGAAYTVWQRGARRADLLAELYGATSGSDFFNREATPLEGLLGGKWFAWQGVMLGGGAGGGLSNGFGTPSYRVVGMAGYRPEARVATDDDADKDGVPDARDACPKVPEDRDGFEDADGCPEPDPKHDEFVDDDGDGISVPADLCPTEPEDVDTFEDADGCPDPDNDGDHILDADDSCPLAAEDLDGFEDADGCPDPDNDRDGFLDTVDACPLDPESPDASEKDGCPDTVRVDLSTRRIDILENIQFQTGKDTILPQSYAILNAVASVLRSHPEIELLRIEGHTDSRGSKPNNKKLSNDRAFSVLSYLVGVGIQAERLIAAGFGDVRPLADNRSDEGREKNRRVEFHIERSTVSEPK